MNVRLALCALAAALAACRTTPPSPDDRWVKRLLIRGNRQVPAAEIEEGLATRATGWWPWAGKVWLDPAALALDQRRVERLYAERGYFDASAKVEVRERARQSVEVEVRVEEGEPTRLVRLALEGLPAELAAEEAAVRRRLGLGEGEVLDYRRYGAAKTALTTLLRERGYGYAQVTGEVRVDRKRRQAAVSLRAAPGPLVQLRALQIAGAAPISEKLVLLQRPWRPGDRFEPESIELLERRLLRMGVFSTVTLSLPEPPRAVVDVGVQLGVSKLRRLRLGGGIGIESRRQELRLLFDWSLRNFLGGLRTLNLRAKPALVAIPAVWDLEEWGIAAETEVELIQPHLFRTQITALGAVGYDLGVEEGYRYHGPRTRLGLERLFASDLLRIGLSWNLQYLTFFNIDQAAFDPTTTALGLGFKNPYRLAWLEQVAALDLRDAPLDARRGGYFELRLEEGTVGVGGDFDYVKLSTDVRGYLPLGNRLTLAGRASFGWLHPFSDDDSPITRRFSLGGANSHRGFSYGRLAPQAVDEATGKRVPLGANAALLLSLEARLRLFRLFGFWLNLVPFCDAGDATADIVELDPRVLHVAVGGSLAYETPIGALRVGVGVRLNRLDQADESPRPNPDPDERIAFHLTIGAAF